MFLRLQTNNNFTTCSPEHISFEPDWNLGNFGSQIVSGNFGFSGTACRVHSVISSYFGWVIVIFRLSIFGDQFGSPS